MSGDPHVEQSGEDRLIAEYFRPLAKHPGAFALMDDAAVITPPAGCDIVLKTDGIIGGVHFFPDDPPDLVGKKALRVNAAWLSARKRSWRGGSVVPKVPPARPGSSSIMLPWDEEKVSQSRAASTMSS